MAVYSYSLTASGISYLEGEIRCSATANASSNTTTYDINYFVSPTITHNGTVKTTFTISTKIYNNSGTVIDTYSTTTAQKTFYTYGLTNIASSSHTIPHDVNGEATIRVVVKITPVALGGSLNTDRTIVLGVIGNRAKITSAPNFTDDNNPSISYTNPLGASGRVTLLQACIASENGSITYVNYRDISKSGSYYTFMLTDTERATLRDAAGNNLTLPVRFYIKSTVDGVTYHHYSAVKTMTMNVDAPALTVTVTDINNATVALTGNSAKMVRGQSNMYCNLTAVGDKGATITSYEITNGNSKVTTANTTFMKATNNVFTFKATDSRGLSSTQTVTVDMIRYVNLTCNQQVTIVTENDNSTQARIEVNGSYYNGSFGAAENFLRIYVRYAENGGAMGNWQEVTALLPQLSGDTYTLGFNVSGLDASGTYEFQCRAVDAVGEVVSGEEAIKLLPLFDWSKTDFNFNIPVAIQGDIIDDFVIDTGTTSMGTNGTWYWRKWKSGRAECYGRRNFGNMAVTTAWGGLYRSSVFSQTLPSGLFTAAPEAIDISLSSADFGGWICKHETSNPTTSNTGSFIVARPASATLSQVYIGFNVIGRWK